MKAAIVFHSICGNTYLMAKMFEEGFKAKGCDVSLLRVKDDQVSELSKENELAKENLADMLALPAAEVEDLLDKDIVVMGSPTYYGNVSAELKNLWIQLVAFGLRRNMLERKLGGFTSAGNSEGGGDHCLQAIRDMEFIWECNMFQSRQL